MTLDSRFHIFEIGSLVNKNATWFCELPPLTFSILTERLQMPEYPITEPCSTCPKELPLVLSVSKITIESNINPLYLYALFQTT